ncbi:hypothetical protein [Streptomyces umbrinus]|uniref:hypothetical protein n=2 Tax=Streptomyces umbrinus TaxID=67370 RepID=UPI001675C41B
MVSVFPARAVPVPLSMQPCRPDRMFPARQLGLRASAFNAHEVQARRDLHCPVRFELAAAAGWKPSSTPSIFSTPAGRRIGILGTADANVQDRCPPAERDVRRSAVGEVRCRAGRPQTAAGMAPVVRVDHSTEQHRVLGVQLLAGLFQAEAIQAAERRQISRAEGGVTHAPRAQPAVFCDR